MQVIYKLGVVIGIIAIYSLVTWGLGALINQNEFDDTGVAIGAWLIGMLAFVVLAVFTLEKFGLWM